MWIPMWFSSSLLFIFTSHDPQPPHHSLTSRLQIFFETFLTSHQSTPSPIISALSFSFLIAPQYWLWFCLFPTLTHTLFWFCCFITLQLKQKLIFPVNATILLRSRNPNRQSSISPEGQDWSFQRERRTLCAESVIVLLEKTRAGFLLSETIGYTVPPFISPNNNNNARMLSNCL